ncbi:MAG: hypothetical protein OEW73_00810 [Gammaproteobacteria bacterium]|jgi:hypothetical protein|nr:hypothetical protein [Gammaproteobacteria bacterium]MDH5239303.1 hypothetical protein [Gammaproteobacteria bacterium]MDH5260936.1 hypothetical protein [Gammaproteobacteria bacterium]MDH5583356.1 hypothetical protein [Gammaproteobacteria bacterium]
MATAADHVRRLLLPTRIGDGNSPSEGCLPRLALAARIADLPGILTVDKVVDQTHFSVNVFLQPDPGSTRKPLIPVRFCSINNDGIEIFGLSDTDKEAIVANGWGQLQAKRVLVYLPRDKAEVEACWRILTFAHERLNDEFNAHRRKRIVSPWALPYFSQN